MSLEMVEGEELLSSEAVVEQDEAEVLDEDVTKEAETGEAVVEEDEDVITIGDAPAPEDESRSAPEWVKELRKSHRELQRENRELKERVKGADVAVKAPEVTKKPTLEDVEYDPERFEVAITEWYESKRKADEYKQELEAAQNKQQLEWQAKLNSYGEAKAKLKVKDFEDAEDSIKEAMNVTQQGVILQGAKNPALVIYALGKNPTKAKELASISDPIKFAFAIADLERDLKVTNRKAAPPPEKVVSGTGKISGGSDSVLERLRAEADKTGDLTKVIAYKRQKQLQK
jgi:hypothetical protein